MHAGGISHTVSGPEVRSQACCMIAGGAKGKPQQKQSRAATPGRGWIASDRYLKLQHSVDGPARAGEKGTPCVPAGPLVRGASRRLPPQLSAVSRCPIHLAKVGH